MAECRLCGHKFDETKEELLECHCGCGSNKVLCPNCGYEVRVESAIPEKPKTDEELGLLGKLVKALRMSN